MAGSRDDTKEGIYREAAEWLLLREEGRLSPTARIRYRRWLTLPFRREAMDRVRQCNERVIDLCNEGWSLRRHEPSQ